MAQRYDVSLKALFLREGDGVIRRLLFGGKVTEHLSTEQPRISNQRADMVVRTEGGALHHVEFQAANEPGFPLRMLEYYVWLVRVHQQHVVQVVLYMGREPLRMDQTWISPSMDFRFQMVNLREFDAGPLLASDDWADNALALLARGEPDLALESILPRLRAMQSDDQNWAAGTLVVLSGILGIEEQVNDRLKELGMINVMENKVLGPMMQQKFEQGLEQGLEKGIEKGLEQGREQGRENMLRDQLADKFGPLPAWAIQRLQSASPVQLQTWGRNVLRSATLDETLSD